MLRTIAIMSAMLVVGLLVAAASKPDTFHVQRTIGIRAPPGKIYPLVVDLRRWVEWSPWERLDPHLKRTYGVVNDGVGAVYRWEGNGKVGAGRMKIVAALPASRITIKLDVLKPLAGHNTAEFTFEPRGAMTTVTWAIYGPAPFIANLVDVFVGMDTMIGRNISAGLTNLRTLAER